MPVATVQCWTGAQTKALRQAMRLSIRAFAAHLGVDARMVNKWEARGSSITLRPDTQALLDTALSRAPDDAQTRFTQTVDSGKQQLTSRRGHDGADSSDLLIELASLLLAHVAATSAGTTDPPVDQASLDQLADYLRTWVADMNRRKLLLTSVTGVGYSFAAGAARVSAAAPGLDIHPAEHFQQMRKVLLDDDRLFGPRTVVLLVQKQIGILQRIRQDYRGVDRQRLLHVQTQFAPFCGWLHQDSGDYQAAAYWYGRALEWAHMCEDDDAVAYMLARKSYLAADMGDPVEAVEAAEAALNVNPRASGWVVTIATVLSAHGYALRRDSASCERLYTTAQDLFGRLETDPSYPWGTFLNRSWIEAQRAHSLAALGEYGASVRSFQEAISSLPRGFRREGGVYLAREAVAHLGHGDVEQASAVGLQALAIGAETSSARIMRELKQLDSSLGKFPASSGAADFHDAMNATFSPAELAGHTVG